MRSRSPHGDGSESDRLDEDSDGDDDDEGFRDALGRPVCRTDGGEFPSGAVAALAAGPPFPSDAATPGGGEAGGGISCS